MKHITLMVAFLFFGLAGSALKAQDTIVTSPPLLGSFSNQNAVVTFNVHAYNDIVIKEFYVISSSNVNTYEIRYNTDSISAPVATNVTNWTIHETGTVSGTASPTHIELSTPLSIPAGETYAICLRPSDGVNPGGTFHVQLNPPATAVFHDANLRVNVRRPIGRYGNFPNPSTHGGFAGSVIYDLADLCESPPTAGPTYSTHTIACMGEVFTLTLDDGTTDGFGQTYEWQSSTDSISWSTIAGADQQEYAGTQLETHYYRCILSCQGVADTSDPVHIVSDITPMSGVYTLNPTQAPSATNFVSLTDFAYEVSCNGIVGPVTLNIDVNSPTFQEQVYFREVAGASSTNTITINGNGNTVAFSATGSTPRYTLNFDNASYFRVNSLNIHANGGQFGIGIFMTGKSSHNIIRNCNIRVNATSSNFDNFAGIAMAGTIDDNPGDLGFEGDSNSIENNTIIGGTYGIAIGGVAGAAGNQFIDNDIEDFFSAGMSLRTQTNLLVDGNVIHRENRNNTPDFVAGIRGSQLNGVVVTNNIVRNLNTSNPSSTAQQRAFEFGAGGSANAQNLLANNMVYNIDGSGNAVAFHGTGANFWDIYHNTFVLEAPLSGTPGTTNGFQIIGSSSSSRIKNNLISLERNGGVQNIFHVSTNFAADVDYNGLYINTNSGSIASVGGNNIQTLADWQAEGHDLNGVYSPVFFADPANDNYIPRAPAFSAAGTNLLQWVPEDIHGASRTNTPDLGAIEFDLIPCAAGPYEFEIDSVTPYKAYISWESIESEWDVQWDVQGYTPGTMTGNYEGPTSNNESFEIDNLPTGQCIDIYLRDICGSDSSKWQGPFMVCLPIDYDLAANLAEPRLNACGDTAVEVSVRVRNEGYFAADSFLVGANISGPGGLSHSFSTPYSGTLNPGAVDTVYVGSYSLKEGGNISYESYISWALDNDNFNDTTNITRELMDAGPMDIFSSHDTVCDSETAVTLYTDSTAFEKEEKLWFIGSTLIGSGNSVVLSQVDSSTIVRLEQDSVTMQSFSAGEPDSTRQRDVQTVPPDIANGFPVFEVFEEITLGSVKIYPQQSGTAKIELRAHPSNTLIDSVDVQVSQVAPYLPVVVNLDIQIPPGQYRLRVASGSNTGNWLRTYNGTSYPYILSRPPNLLSIFGHGSTADDFSQVYQFFYDWKILMPNCKRFSNEFTIERQENPQADFMHDAASGGADENGNEVSFNAQSSSNGSGFHWNFGDGNTASGDSVTHNYTQNGSYEVMLVVSNQCGNDTLIDTVEIFGIHVSKYASVDDLRVYPNPNTGLFTLSFNQQEISDLKLELMDVTGRIMWQSHQQNFSGSFNREFDISAKAAGVYLLRITNSQGQTVKRLIVK